ncbi:MAG: GyrI-like domain-containing protein [Candidatus Bathyarchaeota archaeon]|nr:GyrI-like domain-containing protein [Candidatus Bathyarchaeota archaeon]
MEIKELEVRTERLATMRAVYTCCFGIAPEEEAIKKLLNWAEAQGVLGKRGFRMFGRNTYPTDKPDPRGYEVYLTLGVENKNFSDIEIGEIPGGLYAALRFKGLGNIGFAWKKLWNWIEENGHEHAGWQKGKNGWVGGFEEQVNWQDQKPPTELVFDLWVPLKE